MKTYFKTKTNFVFGDAKNFWLLFVAIGVVMWLSPFFMKQEISFLKSALLGALSLLTGLLFRYSYCGVEIDAAANRFRNYTFVLGVRVGEWKSLPDFKKIRFTTHRVRSRNLSNGTSPTFTSSRTLYKITLVTDPLFRDLAFYLSNRKKAQHDVQLLAAILQLPVEEIDNT
ncbi:hypothetical protein MKJ04_06915 [Pontibacter sp. E15-1]|uniref:hypothetical protein n=1 Tax=Pontibacter sp. E15-1 TaxID=2919918 RepID=UPI001F4F3C35|nr:hypothetical protein [Pontibacter sp. E15-1]MCJ8164573.1 hypothetical protein [Pontibacter sp. E15-1]